MTPDIKYPENTAHKSSQHYVVTIDRNFQIGNSGAKSEERTTQINMVGEINADLNNTTKAEGPDFKVLFGSSERYLNPRNTYLGKPDMVPVKRKEPLSEDDSDRHTHVGIDDAVEDDTKSPPDKIESAANKPSSSKDRVNATKQNNKEPDKRESAVTALALSTVDHPLQYDVEYFSTSFHT